MEAKDNNVARAVVGMDGKQSEVGESNGRSGKSLLGELMRHVTPTVYIPGNDQIYSMINLFGMIFKKTRKSFYR